MLYLLVIQTFQIIMLSGMLGLKNIFFLNKTWTWTVAKEEIIGEKFYFICVGEHVKTRACGRAKFWEESGSQISDDCTQCGMLLLSRIP